MKKLEQEFMKSNWSGGETTQIYIYPEESVYQDQNFLFRISSATVEVSETKFTKLTNYTRYITVLDGKMKLYEDGTEVANLEEGKIFEFKGSANITSKGMCKDFNVMYDEDKCMCEVEYIKLEGQEINIKADKVFMYVVDGNVNDTTFEIEDNELLVRGDGVIVVGKINIKPCKN